MDQSPEIFYEYDLASDSTRWEGEAGELLGWSKEELPSTHREWLDFVHPSERSNAASMLTDCIKGSFSLQFRFRHKAGHYVSIEDCGVCYRDSQGCVTRRIGTLRAAMIQGRGGGRQDSNSELIRNVLDSMFVFVVVLSPDWRITEVNNAPVQAAGMQRHEVIGQSFLDTYWFSDLPETLEQVRRMLQRVAEGATVREDFRVRFLGGEVRVVDATFSPLRDESGHLLQIVGSGVDVTSRRQAEETLCSLARQHEMILNAAGEGICGVDREGRATFINRAAERMLGLSAEEVLGRDVHALVHHSYPNGQPYPIEECPMRAALVDGQRHRSKKDALWRKDGSCFPVEYTCAPIYDGEEVIGAVVVFKDITAQEEAENARRESDLRFRQVVENIREVFWISDLEKNELYVSPGFEDVWGAPRDHFGPSLFAFLEAVHPEDKERIEKACRTQEEGGCDEEFRIVRPDGSLRWVRARTFPVKDERGVIYRLAGLAEDITESRRLNEQLRQSQKMEAVGQLASGVAHDFNNLLTIIQGNTSLLLMELEKGSAAAGYAQDILQASEQSAGLTRQLLLFSSKQAMQQKDLQMNDIVAEVSRMLERVLGEDIALTTELTPGLPLVYADAGMIEQILLNLVVNARDAMPHGGRLVISTRQETVGAQLTQKNPELAEGRYVCVSVRDTGMGILPEIQPRIFEPFFTTKEVGKGTGLGLATVYGIVKQHRGWIEVQSQPGAGTTFRFWLPVSKENASDGKQPQTLASLPKGTGTILLVEDEAALRLVSGHILQRCGYSVLTAENGAAALEVWKENADKIDLLLTDMVMPGGMTGRELAHRLLAEKPNLKVIFTSGYSADVVGNGSILVEGRNFLQKPYQAPKLAKAVRDCLDGSQQNVV